jgi:hypothetical protein
MNHSSGTNLEYGLTHSQKVDWMIYIASQEEDFPELAEIDVVIVGCNETRGNGIPMKIDAGIDNIRKEFYSLYYWHKEIKIADIGNIKVGATLADTYAAVKTVADEIIRKGKKIIILGGCHDLTMAQYDLYRSQGIFIEATGVDSYIDLSIDNPIKSKNFLMEILTGEPNFVRHYNHIGFQSYYVHAHSFHRLSQGFSPFICQQHDSIHRVCPALSLRHHTHTLKRFHSPLCPTPQHPRFSAHLYMSVSRPCTLTSCLFPTSPTLSPTISRHPHTHSNKYHPLPPLPEP